MTDNGRRAELASSLDRVRDRIARACTAAGRPPDAVTLTAVTKTYPASDVLLLAGLGVTDVAENRDQEASVKADAVRAEGVRLRWHFVGQLQRNKARSVAAYADVVESVDSVRLAEALGRAAAARENPIEVLLQVSLDGDPARGGVFGDDLWRVSDAVTSSEGLRLGGLMAVAPLGEDPRQAFARLEVLAGQMASRHPGASTVSAGMSGDLEAAVERGATHVRIGTSLLGMRNSLR
ncbi:YggS family pyridoxal phosphate-dependent enzyme [Actinoplanes couchii]|uniref:Pyridoxal phosphate homeostasis protein n=1 Tax=Actinoplanes couchii TaxID=403638 RepID=A0ABQ3X2W7_9ACTN|nr:YggS family pyridoxal phosphate-dependent enzyme [Actinoplanes couchii]MDR6322616.1 pyridoxal phosphate enzyme (YggS family) [Actinoplanes couchii]GID52849.1 YggS family pyridoxal phosphate enzyme [Actinoplanes couchii]